MESLMKYDQDCVEKIDMEEHNETGSLGVLASLQSLHHNLAWSDLSTKVQVQKVAASSYLESLYLSMHA
jgi:hypothetical protein